MKVSKIAIAALFVALVFPAAAHAETMSRADVRRVVRQAATYYHVSPKWIEAAAIDIIFDGAHESSGGTHAGRGRSCVGVLQFDRGWRANAKERSLARAAGHADWRLSGKASIYRYVRSYRDGGRAAILRHWQATYGR